MAKTTRNKKRNRPPKAKRFTHEQADSFLCELERLSKSEEHLEAVRKDSASGLTHVKALFNRNMF